MTYPIVLAHGVCRFDQLWSDVFDVNNSDDEEKDQRHYFKGIRTMLLKKGYTAAIEEDFMEVSGKDAISNPENIASLLVHEGFPPTMLKVEEEDLESYFLRVI